MNLLGETIYQTGNEKQHNNGFGVDLTTQSGSAVRRNATTLTTAIESADSTADIVVGNASDLSVGDKILIDVNVSVKVLTWHFTVLGEVNVPGKYYFNEPYINILQAVGMAGDLTINGQRENVKIIRFIDEKSKVLNIDLTGHDHFF